MVAGGSLFLAPVDGVIAAVNASATVCGLPVRDRSSLLNVPAYILFPTSLVCVVLRLLGKPGQRHRGFDRLDDWIMIANAVGHSIGFEAG